MNAIRERAISTCEWNMVRLVLAIAAFFPMLAAPTHGADLVINGSFESPVVDGQFNTYIGVDTTSLTGWVVDQANTSVDHDGGLWVDADGFQSIDMNGTEAGSIYQDLATTASQQYTLRFALAGNPFGFDDKRLEVLWDGCKLPISRSCRPDTAPPTWVGRTMSSWPLPSTIRLASHLEASREPCKATSACKAGTARRSTT